MSMLAGIKRDRVAVAAIGLHRRLAAGDPDDGDVAVEHLRLLGGDDVVAVEDPEIDHRLATDPQHEQLAVAGEVLRERQDLLDVLLRQHVGAGGDVADERDVTHRPAHHRDAAVGIPADLDGPWLGGVAADEARAARAC